MRRLWDLRKAQEAEYCTMTDGIMGMFGGSVGRRRREGKHTLIAINSEFTFKKGLSSLDGSLFVLCTKGRHKQDDTESFVKTRSLY